MVAWRKGEREASFHERPAKEKHPGATAAHQHQDVIISGLAGVTAAIFTAKLGVAGTLAGAAIVLMVSTTSTRLQRLPERCPAPPARPPPAESSSTFLGFAAFGWLASRSPAERRQIRSVGLRAGIVAILLGLGIITALELGLQ